MKFGSVCSGIEAASVAWHSLGWKAAWFAEIEPFPSAVLAHHYPSVPNLGDMTRLPDLIRSGAVEVPDILCGGTPCQAFSVAGLRRSLGDDRGNLSLTFCEIADAIDEHRPAIIFWENVPGVLNTKDNAFGCVLAGLAGEDEALVPPGGRWTNAGFVDGPARAVAWRVLDAQYFGLAQRRRRVFVVASARADFDPAAVLFEFEGLRRDTAPSREARKESASGAGASVVGSLDTECGGGKLTHQSVANGHLIGTITARTPLDEGQTPVLQAVGTDCYNGQITGDVAATMGTPGSSVNASGPTVMQPIAFAQNQRNEVRVMQVAGALAAEPGMKQQTYLAQPISIQDVTTREKAQNGKGWNDDGTAYTVDTHATQGVMQPIGVFQDSEFGVQQYDNAGTLRAGRIPEHQMVMQPVLSFHPTQDPISSTDVCHAIGTGNGHGCATAAVALAPTLTATNDPSRSPQSSEVTQQVWAAMQATAAVAQAIGWSEELTASVDLAGTIQRGGDGGRHDGVMTPAMQVRRLTPVECERLQGFPDNYTNIPWRGKPESPDGPRYKALGNSWAVPVVRWIGERISRAT